MRSSDTCSSRACSIRSSMATLNVSMSALGQPGCCHRLQQRPSAQQQLVEQRAAASRRHTLTVCSNNTTNSRRAACTTGAQHRRCTEPAWRRQQAGRGGSTPPAATVEQQQEEQEPGSPLTPTLDSNGQLTTEALARLRYTSPDGRWLVRPLDKQDVAEVRRIVSLQTDAFHTPAPVAALDGFAKRFFEAEVLSEMQKKLRFNPEELFCSLVLEPTQTSGSSTSSDGGSSDDGSSSGSSSGGTGGSGGSHPGVVGVVEVSYIASKEVLAKLEPGTQGFCYVASMVVAPGWRRQAGAQALLRAAELAAGAWEERQTLLHVYQDNEPAVQLYRTTGYDIIYSQKRLLGGLGARPRHLMRKRW